MAQVIFPAVVVPGSTADPAEPSSPSDGQIWVDTDGTAPTTVVTRWSKAPTNGTTTLSGTDDTTNTLAYTPGYEQVFLNGVLLSRGSDYTATTGTSVVLSVATITSDIVEIIAALQVAYTDTITTAAAATTYVPKTLTTTTGDIIYASAANTPARLGIGSTDQVLKVSGGVPTWGAASAPTFSGARVTKSASQSLNASTYTTITFDQEPLDVGGYHDNATNNTRLTVPTGKTGYFLVQWNLHAYNVPSMAYKLLKNGTSIAQFSDSYNWTTGTEVDFTNQWLGALSQGDYVEIQGWHSAGSAKNIYGGSAPNEPTWFQITYLGGV